MSPAAALWWSLGLWVAGILILLWVCLDDDDAGAPRIVQGEIGEARQREAGR